jgi:hypothetical protein
MKDSMKVEDGGVHRKRYDGGIAWNNKLKFQRPHEHPHFSGKVHMSSILLQGIFDEEWCEN